MLIALATSLLVLCAAAALLPRARARRIARRYGKMLEECLDRQPDHEREHQKAHGGHFTNGLRIEIVANRLQRKIHEAGLPALSDDELRRRAREALCPPK